MHTLVFTGAEQAFQEARAIAARFMKTLGMEVESRNIALRYVFKHDGKEELACIEPDLWDLVVVPNTRVKAEVEVSTALSPSGPRRGDMKGPNVRISTFFLVEYNQMAGRYKPIFGRKLRAILPNTYEVGLPSPLHSRE